MLQNNRKQKGTGKLLDLYIRNNKKQALLVHTQQAANIDHISHLINTRFHVPQTDQLLFYNGQRIQTNQASNTLDVQDKAIIHLVDRRNITENLTINVRRLNVKATRQFKVPASQIIEDFIVRNIQEQQASRLFFVYTGRQLNARNTFADQFVQNQSELFCLDEIKDQLIGQKRQKYANRTKKQQQKPILHSKPTGIVQEQPLQVEKKLQSKQKKTATIIKEVQNKQKQQQNRLPNFKKKSVGQQVILATDIAINIHQPNQENHQSSTSLINQRPPQSNLVPHNPFFSEGSSISSICLQQNQNPQTAKRLDEASVMFNSAYIGLNNQSLINQQTIPSRVGSVLANQSDSHEQEIKQQSSSGSFSFDNRAPQMIAQERNTLGVMKKEQMIIQQSQQDYTESKDLSVKECQQQKKSRKNSKDLSGYQLQSIQNHQLSGSVSLQEQIFENKQSPKKNKKSQILIEEYQTEQNRELEYQGHPIDPIPYSHHYLERQIERQQRKETSNIGQSNEIGMEFQYPNRQVDVYLIEQDNLANPTQSQIFESKEQRKTNRESNSNFFSSNNSSRAKQYDINNEYNFGHFQRYNKNRLSGYKQDTPKYHNEQMEHSNSEHHHHSDFKQQLQPQQNQRFFEDDRSLNIVELPVEARIKDNSSLLLNQDSKLTYNNYQVGSCPPLSLLRQQKNRAEQDVQKSDIDQLNKLFSIIPEVAAKPKTYQGQDLKKLSQEDRNSFQKQLDMLGKKQKEQQSNSPNLIETSLNFRMVKSSDKKQSSSESPIKFASSEMKGVLDSYESFQKVQVKISSNLNSYTRSLSNQLRFTTGKQMFNMGDFVFNCDRNIFNPFNHFIELLNRQESCQLLKSYP